MNAKCWKLIICELWVEVEVAPLLGPRCLPAAAKACECGRAEARLSWDVSPLLGT